MEYKWKAFSVTSVGALMSAIDSTIVMLALLPITEDLHTDYVNIVWVIVGYLLINTSLVLSLGRLADIYGRKRMYNIGFVVFTIGSALSGFASSGLTLIIFRLIQGIGAALLTANSFAIISEAFPPGERGKAFGMIGIVWGVGTVLGIILGGVIISYASWRLIFLINIPIGIFGTIWAQRVLKESRQRAAGIVRSSEASPLITGEGRKPSFDIPASQYQCDNVSGTQRNIWRGLRDYEHLSQHRDDNELCAVSDCSHERYSSSPGLQAISGKF